MLNLFTALHTLALTVRDRLAHEEKGASAVEYALLIAAVAAVVAIGVGLLGDQIEALFEGIDLGGE